MVFTSLTAARREGFIPFSFDAESGLEIVRSERRPAMSLAFAVPTPVPAPAPSKGALRRAAQRRRWEQAEFEGRNLAAQRDLNRFVERGYRLPNGTAVRGLRLIAD